MDWVLALIIGVGIAAPLAAHTYKKIPTRLLGLLIGLILLITNLGTLPRIYYSGSIYFKQPSHARTHVGGNMKEAFDSFTKFLRSSKRIILLITITAVITLIIGSMISMWLSKVTNFRVPSFGAIKALGVEAYWDENLTDKIDEGEQIDWGTLWIGSSSNITIYLRSISNVEATLYVNATNWDPANLSKYMNLLCARNGTTVHPDEKIQTTLTLAAPYSSEFILYLITNDVREFSLDIIISTSEYRG